MIPIQMVDLKRQYLKIKDEVDKAVVDVAPEIARSAANGMAAVVGQGPLSGQASPVPTATPGPADPRLAPAPADAERKRTILSAKEKGRQILNQIKNNNVEQALNTPTYTQNVLTIETAPLDYGDETEQDTEDEMDNGIDPLQAEALGGE